MKVALLAVVALALLLVGCGPSQDQLDEAYAAGYNSIWRDKCRNIPQPMFVPQKYDDSLGSGKVIGAYDAGIADAQANPHLCK